MEPANTFWIEVMLAIIGSLSMLILTGVAWFLKQLHNDVRALSKAVDDAASGLRAELDEAATTLRGELDEIAEKANIHHMTLYGPFENNGLTSDVKAIKDIIERRLHQRQ